MIETHPKSQSHSKSHIQAQDRKEAVPMILRRDPLTRKRHNRKKRRRSLRLNTYRTLFLSYFFLIDA